MTDDGVKRPWNVAAAVAASVAGEYNIAVFRNVIKKPIVCSCSYKLLQNLFDRFVFLSFLSVSLSLYNVCACREWRIEFY